MAFEHSPVVMYALDNGFMPEAVDLTQVTAEREARYERVERIVEQLEADTYSYPVGSSLGNEAASHLGILDKVDPSFRRAAVVAGAAVAALATVGSLFVGYKLLTYEPTRPVSTAYCPADAFGQDPPITLQPMESYTQHRSASEHAAKIILTC
jgi:hypothetical protein